MFFRETTSKNSKSPVLQLVENERTPKGPRQRIVVSLGTYLRIPKDDRNEVARIVEERLLGQASLFDYDPRLIVYADKVVKKRFFRFLRTRLFSRCGYDNLFPDVFFRKENR